MSEAENTLSEATRIRFDLEEHGIEVERLGAGLDALATLMSASDPGQTEGSNDNPMLHGLGVLVAMVAERFRYHGEAVQQKSSAVLKVRAEPDKGTSKEVEIAALMEFARKATSETVNT